MKYNLEKLKDPDTRERFKIEIGGRFAPLLEMDDPQEMTDGFTESMNEEAMQVLGKERKKKQPWMNTRIMDKCDERRRLKAKKNNSPEDMEEYRIANNNVKKEIKKAKEEFIEKRCTSIQRDFENNNTREAYATVKQLTKEKVDKTSAIEDENGTLLTDSRKIQNRWTEYIRNLYNHPINTDDAILEKLANEGPGQGTGDNEPEILRSEIEEAIKYLKNGKAAGIDNITAELLKNGGDSTVDLLHKLCNRVWRTGEWPSQWTKSLMIPLPK